MICLLVTRSKQGFLLLVLVDSGSSSCYEIRISISQERAAVVQFTGFVEESSSLIPV